MKPSTADCSDSLENQGTATCADAFSNYVATDTAEEATNPCPDLCISHTCCTQ